MTIKRITALMISLLLILTVLPELMPAAQATPSVYGCIISQNGLHQWALPRYRDPWCEWAGGYIYVCKACKKEVFEEDTPALGHDWAAWTVTKAATCTEKGTSSRTCNRCHKVETQELSSLGHSFTKPWTTVKAPTCEGAGQEVNYCTRCGYEWRRELEATGHDWDDG
ncbi:MAG: hypothetical protein IKS78_09105, partial [Clostridia bacterium]|nr:hypothetical protein [Clostridia bacterium]